MSQFHITHTVAASLVLLDEIAAHYKITPEEVTGYHVGAFNVIITHHAYLEAVENLKNAYAARDAAGKAYASATAEYRDAAATAYALAEDEAEDARATSYVTAARAARAARAA